MKAVALPLHKIRENSMYLKLSEVAAKLNMTTETLKRHCHSGEVPFIRLGKTYRIPADFLRALGTPKSA